MTTAIIVIKGLDEAVDKLNTIEQWQGLGNAMLAVGAHVKGKIDKYPQSTEANKPRSFTSGGNNTWYERGYGPRWARKDGSVGGRKTSETLGRKWTVSMRDAGHTLVVGNNVSYGPFVQDEEEQADFHKRRGWKTVQQVAREEEAFVRSYLEKYIENMLK